MIRVDKSNSILKYLYDKGPTFSGELEKFFRKTLPRSSFFYYLKRLKIKELIKTESIKEKTRTRIKYSITDNGIEKIKSNIEEGIIKLKIDLDKIEKTYFQLITKLEKVITLSREQKTTIFLTWPFLNNIIPNFIQDDSQFVKIKLFMLLNQLTHDFEIKNIIDYSKYAKLVGINKIDLRFYIEKFIERSNSPGAFPDWHKLSISKDRDIFYSFSIGYGRVLYSQILYFLRSDLSFNPILNLYPREIIGAPSANLRKKMDELFSFSSLDQYFEHFFDFEKIVINNSPPNLKPILRIFFNTDYLKILLSHSRNVPYNKLSNAQDWLKTSEKMMFSSLFIPLKEELDRNKTLKILENNITIEIIKELELMFELDRIFLKKFYKYKINTKLERIDECINILNHKIKKISLNYQELYKNFKFIIKKKPESVETESIQKIFSPNLEEIDNKYLQLIKIYDAQLKFKIRNKTIRMLQEELSAYQTFD